ncbi:hypothetical protein [Paenibacillus camelliae]|uniref:hypothetical protein n=1 Tax=Paenibacillus camelliae TaxID=512410 RepID=UPI00203B16B9|nr:hypothetical protein [Paenibacillus camelliae]MCM3633311.1 hypothetical protein [Paenibacillus camelliae]
MDIRKLLYYIVIFTILFAALTGCQNKESTQDSNIEQLKYNGIALYQNNEDHIKTQFLRSINDVNSFIAAFNEIKKQPVTTKKVELKDWEYVIELGEKVTPVNNDTEPYFEKNTSKLLIFIQENYILIGTDLYSTQDNIVTKMDDLFQEYIEINKLYGFDLIEWKKY